MELDLPLVPGAPGEGEVQEVQAHKGTATEAHQDLQDGTPWMKEGMTIWEDWCFKQKRKKNSQGEDPRTLEESSKGGNVSTRQIHSKRKDPKTFEAPVKRRRMQKTWKEKEWKRKKKKRKKREAQKKPLVERAQRTSGELICVGEK